MVATGIEYAEARIAEDFLSDALRAVLSTTKADQLGLDPPPKRSENETETEFQRRRAVTYYGAWLRRLHLARTSVLFSALAAEAAINFYLAVALEDSRDAQALDRLEPAEKFLQAPRLAGSTLFERDREPMGQIVALFRLRNRLVHPKVGALRVTRHGITGSEGYQDFNPDAAANS